MFKNWRTVLLLAGVLAALVFVFALVLNSRSTPVETTTFPDSSVSGVDSSNAPEISATPAPSVSASSEVSALQQLTVTAESSAIYNRDFFNHWISDNSTGCDTRYAVLVEESLSQVAVSDCKVLSGSWVSVYDNVTLADATTLDIDHMVPLAEAWRSGADKWDADTRERFANDLGYANSLVAVTASTNRSKGDKDPSEWLPSVNVCDYVVNWVQVKLRWSLTVDQAEFDTLTRIFNDCDITTVQTPTFVAIIGAETPTTPTVSESDTTVDTRFSSCAEASRNGFHGPYVKGTDVEYDWYRDGDNDGQVCE